MALLVMGSLAAKSQSKQLDIFTNVERVTERNHRSLLDTAFTLTKKITGVGQQLSTRQNIYFYRNVSGHFIKFTFDRGTLLSISTTDPKLVGANTDALIKTITTKELTKYYRGQN
jgi:hypothetical protein